ncbi:MAG: MMPL family transporter [Paludibacteraceae bacterium]|nr:MMPL family transporter [Paludibacteraceae bacterium]
MRRLYHYILFAVTVAMAVVCGIMAFHVNVNADMTKYLPDDSQMKRGLEIVMSEFGSSAQMSGTDVHVMFEGLRPNEIPGIRTLLDGYPDVKGVSYRYSTDSTHTVFDLDVPKSVDQKALGKQISNRFGGNCVVETSQDGATPPVSVMIFAAVLIMVVLFTMAQSWFEPMIILVTALLAIVLNMGTNALLPSVSITTNFIGSILQAVLSLDYCIVMLNRYRQEQDEHTDRATAGIAANNAIKKAAPSILSSALTTVVGLLMLCFMRLKIGADMGIVLAKGVVCSLICTFTAMPALMLLFRKTINFTAKKAYVPSTDRLALFISRHKLPMAIGAVILFFGSWYFSRQTTIFFSAAAESKIEEVFPSPNPFVLVYDTQDEDSVYTLVDSLLAQPGIESVISYPTLMSRPLTPAQMASHVHSLLTDFKDMMPEGTTVPPEALDMVNAEMVQLLYYMQSKPKEQQLAFPDIARFLHSHVASNPLFASYLDEDMKKQIADLQSMLDLPAPEEEPAKESQHTQITQSTPNTPIIPEPLEDTVILKRETIAPLTLGPSPLMIKEDSLAIPEMEIDKIAVVPFIQRLNANRTSAISVEMSKLTDTMAIRLPMSVKEMSLFIGSTPVQTQLVYGYAPGKAKKLSPLQYVHLLVDDLFKRPGLAGMVSEEQRTQLGQRAYLMDLANRNASLTPHDLNILIRAFGVDEFADDELMAFAYPPKKETPQLAVSPAQMNTQEIVQSITDIQRTLHSTDTARVAAVETQIREQAKVPVRKGPSREDLQAELFTELVFGGKTYTASQMASKLARLMKLSNVKAAPVTTAQMSLLYDYYGSVHSRFDTVHLGFGPLLNFLCDTFVYDPRLADVLPDSVQAQATDVKAQMQAGLGQLRKQDHSLLVVLSSLPKESEQTYAFVDTLTALADARMPHDHYYVGESVMYAEMRGGFDHEMNVVTLLTILAIFIIVAITFRSVIVPTILVVTVMSAVFVNVVVAGLVTGQMLYLAYLIVQAILMGATIDYGILFASYYRENRKTMLQVDAVCAAYRGSIRTILTSGLITVIGPGAMALFIDDLMISNIVGCLAVGAFMAIVLTLTVVPAVLVALDRWVVYGKNNRYNGE